MVNICPGRAWGPRGNKPDANPAAPQRRAVGRRLSRPGERVGFSCSPGRRGLVRPRPAHRALLVFCREWVEGAPAALTPAGQTTLPLAEDPGGSVPIMEA